MSTPIRKFQSLLRELFQFDCADLDFGLYRILNYKRDVIEDFIRQDLPKIIQDELQQSQLADQEKATAELEKVIEQINEAFGSDVLDPEGNLLEQFQDTTAGRKYRDLRRRSAGDRSYQALETSIYNHLYAFFSRYYQDGDFISKRRYSRQHKYVIPYNGEEVHLHWANSDQYYVKTTEHFHDYTFTSRGITVHFKLANADVEQDNVKGDQRFFVPCVQATVYDADTSWIEIPFAYRPLTDQEKSSFGRSNVQDRILDEARTCIPEQLSTASPAVAALEAERHQNAEGEAVSCLEYHLRQYTRRNTSDFFIHRDLQGFLSRELDFYLKNEVLNLDTLEAEGEHLAEGWFQTMQVIRLVGSPIIDFLDQIQRFQKMLWEKRKSITETHYCITVGTIDESLYPCIAACDAQWDEWKSLFHIGEEQASLFNAILNEPDQRMGFLREHPTLLLDTKHFEPDFVDRLLGTCDNLDEITDGLLLHSENFQALNLLMSRYKDSVQCIYIDPPYNTDASAILYKNNYKDSTWLSLMADRLSLAKTLCSEDGILCCAIDDEEAWRLRALLQGTFEQELGIAPVRATPAGRKATGRFSPSHEYAFFFGNREAQPGSLRKTAKELQRYPLRDKTTGEHYAWNNLIRHGSNDKREDAPRMFYPIYVRTDDSLRIPAMEWEEERVAYNILENPRSDEVAVWPCRSYNGNVVEKNWHRGWERIQQDPPHEYRVRRNQDESNTNHGISIDFRIRPDTTAMPKTWWDQKEYAAGNYGTRSLKHLFGTSPFDFPKSVRLVEDCLLASTTHERAIVLDYFAGSGTTGHATINLNREDGNQRKFVLTEMGQHFDTVLLPRIKKVVFTPAWKDGKPDRMATPEEIQRSPRIIKYVRLESYEDALNNIEFKDASGQHAMEFEDYRLRYMLQWETRSSATLLNVTQLAQPFSYQLHSHRDGQTRTVTADIPETFNYLLGLHVQTRRVYDDAGQRYLVYRGTVDQRQVTIIWRETEGWQEADWKRDRDFVATGELAENSDEVWVNGDSLIPGAKALDPLFKARMFAPVEA